MFSQLQHIHSRRNIKFNTLHSGLDRMLTIAHMSVLCIFFLSVEGQNCSSDKNCRCKNFKGKLFANCKNLQLRSVPSFSDYVIGISLSNNYISEFPTKLPVNVSYFDISHNSLYRMEKKSVVKFFDDFHKIYNLDLSQNALGEVLRNDIKGDIFRNLVRLSNLNLTRNQIIHLPDSIFSNLSSLSQLNLSYNLLSEFTVHIHHMTELQWLDLSNNQLSFLDKQTRHSIDMLSRTRRINVNLKGNRLVCNCEQIDFVKWMQQSVNVNFIDFGEYTCSFMNSSQVRFKDMNHLLQNIEIRCARYTITIVIMATFIIVLMITTCSQILYRYRWKLRNICSVARGSYRDIDQESEGTEDDKLYNYDAFIVYGEEDRVFVVNLVRHLEEEYNLKLCVHSRDFLPGCLISDNITNSIRYSRRTVCFLTPNFLHSYWCLFEYFMAQMESIYSRNGEQVLVLVVSDKREIDTRGGLHFIIDHLQNKSLLKFPENGNLDEMSAFYSNLVEKLS